MDKKKAFIMAMLLCGSMGIQAHGQSLRLRNVTVRKAMTELRQETGYTFVFASSEVDVSRRVNVNAENVHEAVDQILSGQPVTYEIRGKNVVVSRRPANHADGQQQQQAGQRKQTVTGHVTDHNGEPIVGATIMEKGTQNATVTDVDGNFTLAVSPKAQLDISYIGFVPQTVRVGGGKFNVSMEEDTESLNEVVVVGYGTLKKKDLTGAVAAVDSKTITDRHASSLSQALQGAVAGLTVTNSSGDPTASASLRVRGTTSIGTSDPLVIIDGVPGDMNTVNPDDVESMTVLKDAASAAIYGSRAAAGVILITTKRAKKGDLRLNYNYEYALNSPTTHPKMASAVDYMKLKNEVAYNDNPGGGWNQQFAQSTIENYDQLMADDPNHYADIDWWKTIFKSSAPRQTHTVSLMGGGDKVRTNVSLRYDKFGFLDRSDNHSREHYLARINNDFTFNKYIEAHADVSFRQAKVHSPRTLLYNGYRIPSTYPAYYTDGRIATVKDSESPIAQMSRDAGWSNITNNQLSFKGEVDIKPVEGLRLAFVAAPNFQFYDDKTVTRQLGFASYEDPNTIIGYYPNNKTNSVAQDRNRNHDITMQALANYNVTINKLHDIALLGGYEYFYQKWDNLGASDDFHELIDYPYLSNAPKDYQYVSGNATEYSYRSWFGRVNYSYADKYLFEANVRYDGSSRFAKDNRWATFPSFSAGWVISEENFMKPIRSWLDQLKLRASWGKLGNERIGSYYPYQALLSISNTALVNGGAVNGASAAAQTTYNVRDITWETTTSWDVGLDMLLLNSRLNFTFDLYRKKTTDMLLAVQIPMFMGYDNPSVNAGDMHTNGWDLSAGWRDHAGEFNYSVAFNLSNSVSKMGNLNGTIFYSGNTISRQGTEYREWYGYRALGIYQTQEDVDNSPKLNNNYKVGDLKYEDISGPDGVPDGRISPEYDRVPLKSSFPHFIYGLTFNATWHGFDASVVFQGVGQQYAQYDHDQIYGHNNDWANFPNTLLGNYWSTNNTDEQNQHVKYPRLTVTNGGDVLLSSNYWLYNNHYLRLKNLTIGYTLPQNITQKFFVQRLRFYVAGENLFSINNTLDGYDPEMPTGKGFPIMRSVMFGANVNF